MTRFRRLVVVMALTIAVGACEQARTTVSPSPVIVPTMGTLSVTPGNLSLGESVSVSWNATGGSAVRVEACNAQCVTLASVGVSSGQVTHTPSTPGEWGYVLYGLAAEPDTSVRLAKAVVVVQ